MSFLELITALWQILLEKSYHKLSGTIITNKGVAAKGYKVIAVDKSTYKDNVLGQTTTDRLGKYEIRYHKYNLKRGKQSGDIQIKVVDKKDNSKVYGISSVHFHAKKMKKLILF